ncbi:MAG TPA: shikimate dehydrogenase [Myxococcota bacterium]|nr:shikimate dehydrogenase [Myxococcota bacterium]
MTRARCGIILHPAGHTLSPVLHRTAYAALGLDAEFAVYDVPASGFAERLRELRRAGLTQLCVSLPHKEAALRAAERASDSARAMGAANTLTELDGALVADNTDWIGVTRALEPHGPWPGRRATVLGAGGAARAVVFALRRLGVEVTLVNRTAERAERVAAELGARVGTLAEPWDLLVNATSVGMSPQAGDTPAPAESLRPGALVFDTVYRPLETRLLREARARGCRVQDGLEMLVHQAVEQIRIWSGRRADAGALRRAALEALHSGPHD